VNAHKRQTVAPTVFVIMALIVPAACGSEGEAGEPGTSEASPSQSMPSSMISAGNPSFQAPAQEFTLDEIGFDFGSEDAPISVIEFSDYGCGYCRRFHTDIFPTLMKDYVETGKVRWKYVSFASGQFANGLAAAYAAECAGEQGVFTPMSKSLYERQADWKNLGEPYPVFEELAREAGADADEFQTCIAEQRPRPRVRSGVLSGARLGVRGTPSFLVNGVPLMGAQPVEWWNDAFTAIAADSSGTSGGGP